MREVQVWKNKGHLNIVVLRGRDKRMHAQVDPPHGKDKGIDNRFRTEKRDTKLNDKEKSKTKMYKRQVIAHELSSSGGGE
ncbi:hypothetical protein TNIN_304441 [Trichonephila inaurata madagascariensis]|uniref:Uncharacterized protein n=1 Tax=Trichonephila inaurata madagascariensis TaxID=2747483 RepID=A0A8X7BMC7_9ARAC|nr:hypothetical protein TNIN_304441 [Trichonephila inaurata madagascariensis]